jgi:DNA helicase-2/ATP-dependent DNA helicase PcrA
MSTIPSEPRYFDGPARWLRAPAESVPEGFRAVEWGWLSEQWVSRARGVGMQRASLDSAAQGWLDWLGEVDRLAVVGVHLDGPSVAADLLGFVVEPASRRGIELVVVADHTLEELDPSVFFEPLFGYAYSLERLRWHLHAKLPARSPLPLRLPDTAFHPDDSQVRAVDAPMGVVQIIAPAGSGKTTVLVERVRELRRRGVPAQKIACVTFNRAAARELRQRLIDAGVGDVSALTFHGLGLRVFADGRSPKPKVGGPTLSQWRRLAMKAKIEVGKDGVWLEPGDAQRELSNIKLGLLMTAGQYAESLTEDSDPTARTMAALYRIYEDHQRREEQVDFDDLILGAVQVLRKDSGARGRWQAAYEHMLVDEYQDIEPAQELLVRLIAAPHDQLFCVGDEDQTLYAFRRASVERIICLDSLYPGLRRVALGVNYRCPAKIVAASRTLIEVNLVRFPKQIDPDPDHRHEGRITLHPSTKKVEAAAGIAQKLNASRRGEIVVLARTTDALRPVALACADQEVAIDGPEKLFKPTGARHALQAHLRLALYPHEAEFRLVRQVGRAPGRALQETEKTIAERLLAGHSFETAFEGIPAPKRGAGKLLAPGDLFIQLAACGDAATAVHLLRDAGGFDEWFAAEDGLGGLDQFEVEVLEQAQNDADGLTPHRYLEDLEHQARALRAIRDQENGIELLTIHGAKGRQWPHVILTACEEGTLPHARSLQVSSEDAGRGEGIEAERRLGYVAFTRAQQHLELHYDKRRPSRFIEESGLQSSPPQPSRPARIPPPLPQPPSDKHTSRRWITRFLGGES